MKQSGSVKMFDDRKGFGFLKPEEPGPDVFFHVKELQKAGLVTAAKGDVFLYDVEIAPDGRKRATALEKAKT